MWGSIEHVQEGTGHVQEGIGLAYVCEAVQGSTRCRQGFAAILVNPAAPCAWGYSRGEGSALLIPASDPANPGCALPSLPQALCLVASLTAPSNSCTRGSLEGSKPAEKLNPMIRVF